MIRTGRLLAVILSLFVLPLQADTPDRTEDREQLKQILHAIEESLNKQDIPSLLVHFDEHAILSFMTTEVAAGKDEVLAYYEKMFHLPEAPLANYTTKASLDGPAVFHDDTIVASGRTQDLFELADGRVYEFDTRWVATAIKKADEWKVVSLDFSVDPFENVVLAEAVNRITTYAIAAFLAGLVVMFLLMRLFSRNGKQ